MERLTIRDEHGRACIEKQREDDEFYTFIENNYYIRGDAADKLAAYEDAEEDGAIVNVVRCKDCIYAPTGTDNGEEQGFGLEWPYRDSYKCPFQCDDGWYSKKPKPDFFCANGERKQD